MGGPRLIDLSADIGESFGDYRMGDDEGLLRSLTSANIACGFHAGDPRTMAVAVRQCVDAGVAVGAHPGFPDLVGFGRRHIAMTPDEVRTDVMYQVGALQAFASAAGTRVHHVSPHGRLGNLVVTDEDYARPVAEAIAAVDSAIVVVTYSGTLQHIAVELGLTVALMAFPDRGYEPDGTLVSRGEPDAVLHDPDLIAERAVAMATTGVITARDGSTVAVEADTVLLHGDNAASVHAAAIVRTGLEAAGVTIAPLADVLSARPAI